MGKNNKALSLDEMSSKVRRAFYEMLDRWMLDAWITDVYADYVICEFGGEYYKVAYTMGETVDFAVREAWEAVEKEWVTKSLGALSFFGDAVKALGNGKVGGYLVKFGSPAQTDLVGEYFDANTDFAVDDWDNAKCTIYYQHGLDDTLKTRVLGTGKLQKDDVGVFVEAQLNLRDEYEKAVYDPLTTSGKMGWSSGTAGHLVERERVGKSVHITRWPLGVDGSLTPTPAEPRTFAVPVKALNAVPLKSLIPANKPEASPDTSSDVADAAKGAVQIVRDEGENGNMGDNGTPPADDRFNALEDQVKSTSEKLDKVLKYMEDAPALKSAGYFTEDGGTADARIKNAADMLMAIKRGDVTRCVKHYGLKAQVEDQGATGGYWIPQQQINDLLPGITLSSPLGRLVRRIPVQSPAGTAPIRDYSRVPTADAGNTASAMGMQSQGRAEGGAFTEETIYFELLKWRVWDYASGYVKVSQELRQDAPMIEAFIREAIEEDVANKEEFAILRGNGVGMPLGVLNWDGRIEIDEDTDNTFAVADSDEMVSRLLRTGSSTVAWVHHPGAEPNIAGFKRQSADYHGNLAGAMATNLHGYPRLISQHLPAQGTDGYVILGDWKRYILFEYKGLYIKFSEHADMLNGNDVWTFGKRQDGQPAMTSAVTLADGSFTLSPFVILANKT